MPRVCALCGKSLTTSWQKLYCSRTCANKGTAKQNSISKLGVNNPMYGKRPHNYKGRHLSTDGYWYVMERLETPEGVKYRKVREHIQIMERIIGRGLRDDECVHHINGIKTDNRPDNLRVMNRGEHTILHFKKIANEKRAERSEDAS